MRRLLLMLILTTGCATAALDLECRQSLALTRGEAPNLRSFVSVTDGKTDFGFSSNIHWLRLNCLNIPLFSPVYLEIENPQLDDVQVFAANDLGRPLFRLGDRIPIKDRPLKVSSLAVPIATETLHSGIVLRVKSTSSVNIPVAFLSEPEFIEHHLERRLFQGVYLGTILTLIILNLWLLATTRNPMALYFIGYATSFMVLQVAWLGWAAAYFHSLFPISLWLTFASLVQFFRSFLRTDREVPRVSLVLYVLQFSFFTMAALSLFLPQALALRSAILLGLITGPLLLGLSLWLSRRDSMAYFFATASVVFGLGLFMSSMNIWPDYGTWLGSALHIVLLSAGVGYGLRLAQTTPTVAPQMKSHFNLVEMISEIAQEARLKAKNVRIDVSVSEDEAWFYGSKADLKTALMNFISNSFEAESRWVSIRLLNRGSDVAIEIQDNGRGMTANVLKKVRSGTKVTTKPNGSGLGLPSAFRTLHLNGARIVLDSRIGVGTFIQIAFPVAQPESAPAEVTIA